MLVKVLYVLKKEGKTIGIEGINVKTKEKLYLDIYDIINENIQLENAILTNNLIIRGKVGTHLMVKDLNVKILYHGSKTGLNGKINPFSSRITCDFGQGFYTGDKEIQAQQIILSEPNGVFYTLEADLTNLNVYTFKSDVLWALYVAYNREKIEKGKYPKLDKQMIDINKHDVIVGLTADDRMNEIYPKFFVNAITDNCLSECLKCVDYSKQYVFKTQRACDAIRVVESKKFKDCDIKSIKSMKKKMLGHLSQQIENLQEEYLGKGLNFSQILKQYK